MVSRGQGPLALAIHMPSAAHALAFTDLQYLPISHIVDGIGCCKGLRENLLEVEDMMGTVVQSYSRTHSISSTDTRITVRP